MANVYIFDMLRVPTGKLGGYYKNDIPENLMAFLIEELLKRTTTDIEFEVLLANAIGTQGNMARYITLKSGLPEGTKASTVDVQCGGSYQTIRLASAVIRTSGHTGFLVGGMESNTLKPTRIYHKNDERHKGEEHMAYATFAPNSELTLQDSAELLGQKYQLNKSELQAWTVESHLRLASFAGIDLYQKYIIPYHKNKTLDQPLKSDISLERLQMVNDKGTLVDSTTSAHYHDGAAVLLLGGDDLIKKGLTPIAKIAWIELKGVNAEKAPEGAVNIAEVLKENNPGLWNKINLFQVNESFGVKPLSFMKHFRVDSSLMNVLGGNLAYGHPYGASGAIDLMQLVMALQIKKQKFGLLTAGVAGGFGAGVVVENLV